jgi:trans-aconitate methyltransferase
MCAGDIVHPVGRIPAERRCPARPKDDADGGASALFVHGCDRRHGNVAPMGLNTDNAIDGLQGVHFTYCNRSRILLSMVDSLLRFSGAPHPRRVLSFGASTGVEAVEAQAFFPLAEVAGYDVSASSIALGARRYAGYCNCAGHPLTLTSERARLPPRHFDLILANEMLGFTPIAPSVFEDLLEELVALAAPGATLAFTISENFMQWESHREILNTLVLGTWRKFGRECVTLRAVQMTSMFVCRVP